MEKLTLITGRVQAIARGGAFLICDGDLPDLFIPADKMNGAMHADMVEVQPGQVKVGETPETEVVRVVTRAHTQIVGTVCGSTIVPDEHKLPTFSILYGKGDAIQPEGTKVVAQIVRYAEGTRPPLGKIVETLGQKGDKGVDVMSVIRRYGIRETFPDEVLAAAMRVPVRVEEQQMAGRRDLREWVTFTIDGRDSKDFDDAVSAALLENGNIELGVHIADVTAYVPENGALDREARLRGTSVYFADRVIPMLPEALSNGICSLNEGEDRLTLSCIMEVDHRGTVVKSELVQSVIRSHHRLVYDDVSAVLTGEGRTVTGSRYSEEEIAALHAAYADVLPALILLQRLQGTLFDQRTRRGSIDFDLPECSILLDEEGRAVGLRRGERGISNRIIEECMLLANETVAGIMLKQQAPFLYRVHEKPDGDRIRALNTFLGMMGYSAIPRPNDAKPIDLQHVVTQAVGKPEEALIGKLALRAMQKARYCESCLGHFGLAAKEYCHFTSPIRRYPDLFIHRVIRLWLDGELNEPARRRLNALAIRLADETSVSERSAMEAERAVDDLKKCEYMASRIGHSYKGMVSGVMNFGLFVELPNTAEGMLRLSALNDDYYTCEPEAYRVVGRRHGGIIRLGDFIRVTVNSVDLDAPTIDFIPKTDYHNQSIYNRKRSDQPSKKAQTPLGKEKRHGGKQEGKQHATRKGHKATSPKPKGKA
ncbi:MAG: ribonuclease R [Clostridia bacterium]